VGFPCHACGKPAANSCFLWEIAEKEIDREYMIQALLDNYQVTKEQAVKDVDKFIDIVTDNKFIEE